MKRYTNDEITTQLAMRAAVTPYALTMSRRIVLGAVASVMLLGLRWSRVRMGERARRYMWLRCRRRRGCNRRVRRGRVLRRRGVRRRDAVAEHQDDADDQEEDPEDLPEVQFHADCSVPHSLRGQPLRCHVYHPIIQ